MSAPSFVAFTALADGAAIEENVNDNITGLSAVPASQLPSGVAAGTFIEFSDRTTAVRGTVAATLALIVAAASGGIGSPSNAIYVDVAGDDATGQRGNSAFPFLTIQAALNAQTSNFDEILVGPGLFSSGVVLTPVAGMARCAIKGAGSQLTFIQATVGINVITPNNAGGSIVEFQISGCSLGTTGAGKCIVGTGAASATLWLGTGLFLDDVVMTVAASATLAIDLTYAGVVRMTDCRVVTGSYSFTVCSDVRLTNVQSDVAGTFLTTWSNTDALRPVAGQGTTRLLGATSVGIVSMTGQAQLACDQSSSAASLTGLNLSVAAGPVNPSLNFFGTVGTIDFGSAAAKIIPDSALGAITWNLSGCTITGATAEFESVTTDQIVQMTGFISTGIAFALTAGVRALVVARGAVVRTEAPATMWATPDATGSITPPFLKGLVDIAAGGALAKTWANLGYTALIRVGTAVFEANVSSNIQGADAVVPIAGKVVTGVTITSTAQAGNTAANALITF